MPRVPTLEGPALQTRQLSTPMQGQIDVSSGLQAASRAAGVLGDLADKQVRRAAEAEANQVDAEITTGWLEWDAQARRQYRGANVGEYETKAKEWWDTKAREYGGKVSPLARQALDGTLLRKRTQALGSVLTYAGAERERHADEASAAAVQTTIEMGIDTGDTRSAALDVRRKIAEQGSRKGWTTEQVQAEQQRALGTMHLAYITRLAQSNPTKATEYFEANKEEIPATAQVRVETVLKGERDNQAATQFAASVAARPLSEQLAEAGKISDPEVRAKALAEVKNNHAMVTQAKREREQAAGDQAWQLVGQGRRVPESVLASMDGRERVQLQEHLRARAERVAKGTPVKTNWAVYEEIRGRIAAGEKVRVSAFSEVLAPGEIEKLIDVQTKISDPKKAPEVASAEQQVGTYVDRLKLSGEKDQEKKGLFRSAAQDLFNEHLKRTGKEPTFDERQAILDKLVVETVTKPGFLWDTKEPTYMLPRDRLRQEVLPQAPRPAQPARITSTAEWAALPKGTQYIDPQGNLRTKQ